MSAEAETIRVVARMEQIFQPLDGLGFAPAPHPVGEAERSAGTGRRGWRRPALLVSALAVAVAALLGAARERSAWTWEYLSGTMRHVPAPLGRSRPISTTSAGLVVPVASGGASTPSPTGSVAPPFGLPAPDPTGTRSGFSHSGPDKVHVSDASGRPPAGRASFDARTHWTRQNKADFPPSLSRQRGEPPGDGSQCRPGSQEDQCIYRDVTIADARLRSAYDHAYRSGVPRSTLTSALEEWSRARRRATDDPDGTIERYERLTETLDRARRDGYE